MDVIQSACTTTLKDGNTEYRAGSQRPSITSNQEDRYLTRMALMDRAATSRALSQELGPFARQQVSARTIRQQELLYKYNDAASGQKNPGRVDKLACLRVSYTYFIFHIHPTPAKWEPTIQYKVCYLKKDVVLVCAWKSVSSYAT
ncbi:hypothetical protein TNCV_702711 [Trichonephila clavipes]|nr:hypothetical protein TNCV_702711 [Trichonephila clavipes]